MLTSIRIPYSPPPATRTIAQVFHKVAEEVDGKSVPDVIEFYYMWKKSQHYKQWKAMFRSEQAILQDQEDDSDEDDSEEEEEEKKKGAVQGGRSTGSSASGGGGGGGGGAQGAQQPHRGSNKKGGGGQHQRGSGS